MVGGGVAFFLFIRIRKFLYFSGPNISLLDTNMVYLY